MDKLINAINMVSREKGDVYHAEDLFKDISAQFLNQETSDVTLIVEAKQFNCHKIILASRSEYFKALLYGNMEESLLAKIEIKEISAVTFELLLNYIYTGRIDLTSLKLKIVLDVLHLANRFMFESLESAVCQHLEEIVDLSNICIIFQAALFFQIKSLENTCFKFIDYHTNDEIEDVFTKLPMHLLKKILKRGTFFVDEVHIFRAIKRWIENNKQLLMVDEIRDILSEVRLPFIAIEDLINEVWPTKLFSDADIFKVFKKRLSYNCGVKTIRLGVKYRGYLIFNKKRVHSKDGSNVEVEKEYEIRKNNFEVSNKSLFSLRISSGKAFAVNYIKIRQNKFYINPAWFLILEMSIDGINWLRVKGYKTFICQNWVSICFPQKFARHFRIFYPENYIVRPSIALQEVEKK